MSEVKEIKKRIDFLDYLKAICVIMVIITHYDWADKDSPFFTMLINMAVPVFMIISGYNFAMSNRKKTGGNLKKMYAWEMIKPKLIRFLVPFFTPISNNKFAAPDNAIPSLAFFSTSLYIIGKITNNWIMIGT